MRVTKRSRYPSGVTRREGHYRGPPPPGQRLREAPPTIRPVNRELTRPESYTAGMPGSAGGRDSAVKCAFCAIIRGEATATRILETEHLLAFLDIRPLFHGHTLLVPKAHLRLLSDLPAAQAAEVLLTAPRLGGGGG